VTQNGRVANCIQDARLTVEMERRNAGVSEVKVWVKGRNAAGLK